MNVLGISCYYHDSAAALVRDGLVVAAAEEERFTRKKHDNSFPKEAISFVTKYAGLSIAQLDAICFYEKPVRKLERLLLTANSYGEKAFSSTAQQLSLTMHERVFVETVIREELGFAGNILFSDHHLSHAASAFFTSPFEDAAILTLDGVGEFATTAEYLGHQTEILPQREIHYPHSLGLLYSTVTAFLGFKVNNDEYKVMGLASYGTPRYLSKLQKLIHLHSDGSFELDLRYFDFPWRSDRMFSDLFVEEFGVPRVPESEISAEHTDLAASIQKLTEDVLVFMGQQLYQRAGGTKNICLAGGVALNCVANTKLINETPFESIYIQPAAGDAGGSVGAALLAYYDQSGSTRVYSRNTSLLGPGFSNEEIETYLRSRNATYQYLDDQEICRKGAELINDNFILGWFQGRMEFGPRALGCRSILANACNPEMKDILNARVKFREDFRPFAPAVLAEEAGNYFDLSFETPHMLFVTPVLEGKGPLIPSVTHSDSSARVQTVKLEDNPRFYNLIKEFGKLSGVPVVINTSFNIRGEPIVCQPHDAYECFMRTDIDFLIIGNFLVEKLI